MSRGRAAREERRGAEGAESGTVDGVPERVHAELIVLEVLACVVHHIRFHAHPHLFTSLRIGKRKWAMCRARAYDDDSAPPRDGEHRLRKRAHLGPLRALESESERGHVTRV